MKRVSFSVGVLTLVVATLCLAQSQRSQSSGGMWFGKLVWARLTEETFINQPKWTQTSEAPLSAAAACKKATEHIATMRGDQLKYRIQDVSLHRYFGTDDWFYKVHFEAVVRSGDTFWQTTEPYRSLLASEQYPPNTNVPPRLDVFLLLSGDIIPLVENDDQPHLPRYSSPR